MNLPLSNRIQRIALVLLAACCGLNADARALGIPSVHRGIVEENGQLVYVAPDGSHLVSVDAPDRFTLSQFRRNPVGTNNGGGERDIMGTNACIMKHIAVACAVRDVRFLQFTGDLASGYTTNESELELELVNWKRAVEPYAHSIPFIAGIGNHEYLMYSFQDHSQRIRIDRFPFETESSETVFARHFVNPLNGPVSEDGSSTASRRTNWPASSLAGPIRPIRTPTGASSKAHMRNTSG